ncbi:hypothetical protein GCM10022295_91460 [Streptomyces osmaniensis]|uniref:Uncharacterized protein n=1 Tax=Streptomyces osmaniensis TaxID=593134 RepID=A0ABP6Z3K0_9ACTN
MLLQGIYRGPDGRERMVATYAEEHLFEVGVRKAGGGKTERVGVHVNVPSHVRMNVLSS